MEGKADSARQPCYCLDRQTGGLAFFGKAKITNDPVVSNQIVKDYPQKYLLARFGFHKPSQEMFTEERIVAIKITPVRDLPEGFVSAPGTPALAVSDASGNRTSSSPR
ncbi:MAG: hypothetical protein WCA59_19540 [Candidatus Binataceae bacterium]